MPVKRSRGKSIEVVAPPLPSGGGVSWRERATWPDSPDAARYITETLLGEAENRATNSRYFATLAEHAAVEAEANRRGVDVYWVHPPQRSVPSDHR